MEKSHKIYNLIFDLLLTAGVCAYNDLRFMRFWFLGGRLYHATGFANYRFGLTGKEVCWDFSPLNILHCLQGYDPHAYLKFLCFFCIGILMFFRFVFRAPKLLPRLFARLFCFSAGYIAVVELYNLLFTAAGAVILLRRRHNNSLITADIYTRGGSRVRVYNLYPIGAGVH